MSKLKPVLVVILLLFFGFAAPTPGRADGMPNIEDLLDETTIVPKGEHYESTVPDTLDLAQRAEFSLNVLTSNVEPEQFYSVYQGIQFSENEASMGGLTWNLLCKNVRALPMLRTMCGSDFNVEVEYDMMKTLLQQVAEDGQIHYPYGGEGAPVGTSYPLVNGVAALALLSWYQRDANPKWLQYESHTCGVASLHRSHPTGIRRTQPNPLLPFHGKVTSHDLPMHVMIPGRTPAFILRRTASPCRDSSESSPTARPAAPDGRSTGCILLATA
jgi:hypothetical protein